MVISCDGAGAERGFDSPSTLWSASSISRVGDTHTKLKQRNTIRVHDTNEIELRKSQF
jgi:hypothetical protein